MPNISKQAARTFRYLFLFVSFLLLCCAPLFAQVSSPISSPAKGHIDAHIENETLIISSYIIAHIAGEFDASMRVNRIGGSGTISTSQGQKVELSKDQKADIAEFSLTRNGQEAVEVILQIEHENQIIFSEKKIIQR